MNWWIDSFSTWPDLSPLSSDELQTFDFLVDVVRFSLQAFQTGGFPDAMIDKAEHFD